MSYTLAENFRVIKVDGGLSIVGDRRVADNVMADNLGNIKDLWDLTSNRN